MSTIKEFRTQLGLPQAELGRLVGVKQGAIGNYEAGTRLPEPEIAARLVALAREHGFPLTWEDIYVRDNAA